MTKRGQVWKCNICGNIIEVLHEGADKLVCCGQPMNLQEENTVDAALEKHVPIIEGRKVTVGSVAHPMDDDHYIEWIEAASANGETCKKFLSPGDAPEIEFAFDITGARAYCNLHGLWKSQ